MKKDRDALKIALKQAVADIHLIGVAAQALADTCNASLWRVEEVLKTGKEIKITKVKKENPDE